MDTPRYINNPALTAAAEGWARTYLGEDQVRTLDLRMTADDFAFYGHKVPGCYFRIGTSKDGEAYTSSVHTPNFDIDESAMVTAIGLMSWLCFKCCRAIEIINHTS